MLFFLFMNVKMPMIVGILTFMGRKKFMKVEHEKNFITSGHGFERIKHYPQTDWYGLSHVWY